VLKDTIGNSLAAVNSRSSWYWVGKLNSDNYRPKVSFVGGHSTGSIALVGYVFFSEQVAATTSASCRSLTVVLFWCAKQLVTMWLLSQMPLWCMAMVPLVRITA